MRARFLILTLLSFCLMPVWGVHAAVPIKPQKKPDLPHLQQQLEKKKKEKARLERRIDDIETSLEDTRKHLITIGDKVQKNEKELQSLENRIEGLEIKQLTLQQKLKNDRQSISRLILALERIRRVPPEALIAKPDAPLKTAQSAMLMRNIIPAINQQAEALRTNLEDLENITTELQEKRSNALKTASTLKTEYSKMSSLVERREKLYASTHRDLEKEQQRAKQISRQAQNIKDLVKRLDTEKQRTASLGRAKKKKALPPVGNSRLPISGIIRIGYNDSDAFGAPSKGLSIEGLGGSLIVAPMGGTVRFAGQFKNYGNMMIVEHKNGYHSLIAGFEKIDTVVGQRVSAGEPLGYLHYAENNIKPALYYELRHNGKPINPAQKLGNLS